MRAPRSVAYRRVRVGLSWLASCESVGCRLPFRFVNPNPQQIPQLRVVCCATVNNAAPQPSQCGGQSFGVWLGGLSVCRDRDYGP